jgi:hypothetical protein
LGRLALKATLMSDSELFLSCDLQPFFLQSDIQEIYTSGQSEPGVFWFLWALAAGDAVVEA